MLVYLAGPIDYVGHAERRTWREEAKKYFDPVGVSTFDPSAAFSYHNEKGRAELAEQVRTINDSAMLNSDFSIFYMPRAINSVGTVTELITLANSKQHRALVVIPDCSEIKCVSAYLLGHLKQGLGSGRIKLLLGPGALSEAIATILKEHRRDEREGVPYEYHVSQAVLPQAAATPKSLQHAIDKINS